MMQRLCRVPTGLVMVPGLLLALGLGWAGLYSLDGIWPVVVWAAIIFSWLALTWPRGDSGIPEEGRTMIYEYAFGAYVEADSEQEAWEKVRPISEALDAIDVEGDSAVEGPFPVPEVVKRDLRRPRGV